jgi:tetratricopeptide (TPR) repeat protein
MSIRCFEEAVESDPAYAPAYTGIADAYLTIMDHGSMPQREATTEARAAVLKALRLDEYLAEAHASLAHAAFHEFDWPTAESEFVRAIDLNPNYSSARHYYSNYLCAFRRFDEAIAQAEEARRLDPVSAVEYSNLSSILWLAGRYEQAIEQAKRIIVMNPEFHRAYQDLAVAYAQLGKFDDAIDSLEKSISIEGRAHATLASLAHVYALAGRTDETRKILRELQEAAKSKFVSAYSFALIYSVLGELDEAFAWFDKAYDERSPALPFLRANPRFASLRGEPRFEKLVERVFGT